MPITARSIPSPLVVRLALLVALASPMARAQEGMRVGPILGYEFGVPLALARGAGSVNGQEVIGSGSSFNNTLRLGGYGDWGSLFGDGLGLALRGELLLGSGLFRSTYDSDLEFDPVAGAIVPSRYQYRITSATAALQLDARARIALGDAALELGPWVSNRLWGSFTTVFRKLGPLPAGSGVQDSTIPELPGSAGSAPWHGGVVLGGSMRIPYNDAIDFQPELALRLDATALDLGIRRSLSVGAGLALLFGGAPPADTIAPPLPPDTTRPADTPVVEARDTAAPPPASLSATIDIYGIGPDGAPRQAVPIAARLVRQRRETPFPAALFFEEGASALPERYRRSTTAQAERFSLAALARMEHDDVYLQALDILGLRLRENPNAKVTLTGSASKNEPSSLALERARGVRGYLRDVWGIDEGRIALESASRAASGAIDRCVLVRSDDDAVTAPVAVEWNARTFGLPSLDIQPAIRSSAGVREWEVSVRQGSEVMTHYSSRPGDQGSSDLAIHIPDDLSDSALPPLVAELAVTDSAGASVVARDSLPLTIVDAGGGARAEDLPLRSDYLLLSEKALPAFSRGGSSSVRSIASALRSGDRVTVTTAAPGSGNDVADALRRLLKGRGVKVELRSDGASRGPADDPERDLLARGVTVLVERGKVDPEGRQ